MWNALRPTTESTYNSAVLLRKILATPCGLSLRSGRLTAIKRKNPANFPQIFASQKLLLIAMLCSIAKKLYEKRPPPNPL
jgi:hypothetical protein